jgi:pyruvate formate lyase activating enzyme
MKAPTGSPARFWHPTAEGRIQCDLCPRGCTLSPGQRAYCYVRGNEDGQMVLATYGRSSGFCLDPIEKKPLHHFLPGSAILSFGTAGCNLGCKFCQNWDISKARDDDRLAAPTTPEAIAAAAVAHGARAVAFTYNDPVIFAEWALDVAAACRAVGVRTVAVTAGYITPAARTEFFASMDAANVDLKAFSDDFYHRLCAAELGPVLDTLRYLARSSTWLEVTTLIIPGHNDGDRELDAMLAWYLDAVGPEVPLHLTAFHPDFRMPDVPATPPATLRRARQRALAAGVRHVYTGNIADPDGQTTRCAGCDQVLIERDGYRIRSYHLEGGACPRCARPLAGHFEAAAGTWGARRLPVLVGA